MGKRTEGRPFGRGFQVFQVFQVFGVFRCSGCLPSSDSGVIHSESDWTFRGNAILRNNFTGVHSLYNPRDLVECAKHVRKGGWCGDQVKALRRTGYSFPIDRAERLLCALGEQRHG